FSISSLVTHHTSLCIMFVMKVYTLYATLIALLAHSLAVSQTPTAPPQTVETRRPALKRDRTQRLLYPKIIQYEDERIIPPDLVEMLQPPHGGVRRRAILALGRIGYPSGLGFLVDVLNGDKNAENRNPELRALAAFSLGEIESHHAASYLLQRLDPAIESSYLVRGRAVEALGKIASNSVSAAALGNYGVKGIADAIAASLPPTNASPSGESKFIASMALTALLRIKRPSSVEAVAAQLRSPDADLRWQAANALARIREGIAVATASLLPLLDDSNALVRAHAARALGVAKAAQAVGPLTKLLADKDERVVVNSINALGAIGEASAVDPLVALGNTLLSGYRSFDREKSGVPTQQNALLLIATALGTIKDARGLAFLKAFRLADGHLGAFPEVEVAVAKFGEAAFFDVPETVKLPKDDWKSQAAYAQGLGQLGTERAKAILLDLIAGKTYGKPDPRAVPDILNAMSAVKVEGLRTLLIENLKAEDVIVRTTAATLLGTLGDESDAVIKALEEAYKVARADKMNDARIAILEATDKLHHPLSALALEEATRDEDYVVRLKAAELMRQSTAEQATTKLLQIGKVATSHNRAYWQRVAQMAESVKDPVAVLHTKKGDVRIELLVKDAPMTVDNFIQLARSGFYNGLAFVRIVPNFVVQSGDPRGDQNGGPGYQIRDEINLRQYETGTVGMALSGKDTGGSQFFITHSPQPHLDGGYTVFGQVVDGMEVVNRLARGDLIQSVEIVEQKQK
ncbi:MAG TPA: peptidylprolyl isomerase, partial [Blastocatellia bacterium]|nr:peptidylprolyl isomerase [Blastocatellia bacterium]